MKLRGMLVGNSDGIGLATTRRLLEAEWDIIGISRSESPIPSLAYHHRVADVSDRKYSNLIDELLLQGPLDLRIYFVGIGELLDPIEMSNEPQIIEVNLTGMVKTAAAVIPQMVKRGQGHFVVFQVWSMSCYQPRRHHIMPQRQVFLVILEAWR